MNTPAPPPEGPGGLPERYRRADLAARRRQPGQRWGLPAVFLVLGCNLAGFLLAPLLVARFTPALYVIAIMTPTVLAIAAAIAISVFRGNGPLIDFGLPSGVGDFVTQLRAGLAWGAIALFGGFAIALILVWYFGTDKPSPLTGLAGISPGWRIVLVAWVWIGAPIGEELMFRGMLWGALEKRSWAAAQPAGRWLGNRWVILAVTTLVFAGWHREWWRFAVLVWGGFAIGMARLRTGSVFASSTAHALNNSLPALGILFLPM